MPCSYIFLTLDLNVSFFLYLCSFQVYDADGYARSRYHLLQRAPSIPMAPLFPAGNNLTLTNSTLANLTVGKAAVSSTVGSNATLSSSSVALPGAPGRWRLPPDPTGLKGYAHMLLQINSMSQTYTLYYFLQVVS